MQVVPRPWDRQRRTCRQAAACLALKTLPRHPSCTPPGLVLLEHFVVLRKLLPLVRQPLLKLAHVALNLLNVDLQGA